MILTDYKSNARLPVTDIGIMFDLILLTDSHIHHDRNMNYSVHIPQYNTIEQTLISFSSFYVLIAVYNVSIFYLSLNFMFKTQREPYAFGKIMPLI